VEGGLETTKETELIVEPPAEPVEDREPIPTPEPEPEPEPEPIPRPETEPTPTPEPEPTPPPDIEPAPEAPAEPVPEPKSTGGPEPIPEASVIPLGEPRREQLTEPEKAAEFQSGTGPSPEVKPEPEPAPRPIPQPEPVPAPEPKKEPEPVVEELSADELIEAYEQDAPAADARFLHKRLEVVGVVALIDVRETVDTHYVRLAGADGDISRSVRCMFDKKHAPALSQLQKGQTLTVQGKFNGSIIAIRMTDCELA
jgi:hypothetical protein